MIIPAENIVQYMSELIAGMNGLPKRTILAVLHKKIGYSRHSADLILKSLKLENFASEDASEGWVYPVRRQYRFDLTEINAKQLDKKAAVATFWTAMELSKFTLPRVSVSKYPYDYIVRADNSVYRFIIFDNDGEYKLRHAAEEVQQTICPVTNVIICINCPSERVRRLMTMDKSLDDIANMIFAEVKCDENIATDVKIWS